MIRKIVYIIFILLVAGAIYLYTEGQKVLEVTSQTTINAPKDKVWAVVSNIDGWANVTSAINASSGKMADGASLSITMRGEKGGEDGPTYAPQIIALDDGTSFHWRGFMGASFIMRNDKIIRLEAADGGTKMIHTESFSGMMVPLMNSFFKDGVPPILDEMNEGFKAAAEGG